jgi:hypothetical protein
MTDGSGRLRGVHPVDQAVALGLGLVHGTIGSAPEIGAKFDRLRRASLKDLQKECEFMVEQALERLIASHEIDLRDVVVTRPMLGRVWVAVHYVNRRLSDSATKSAGFGF